MSERRGRRERAVGRIAAATVALLIAGTGLGVVGLAAGELIPDRWVADGLHDARVDGSLSPTRQDPTRLGGVADHFTECITISVGLGEDADAGFLHTLAAGTHLGPCERLIRALDDFDRNGQLPAGSAYLRYWHGTSAVFRPVIAAAGLPTLRLLSFVGLVLATVSLGRRVRGVAGSAAAVGLLLPLIVTTDYLELVGVAHFAVAMTVTLLGAELALFIAAGNPTGRRIWFAGVVAGAAFVYVDLLTSVPGAWILPAAMTMLAVRQTHASPSRVAGLGLVSGLGWITGYAGLWLGKWVFAAAVLGRRRVVDDVRNTISERIDGESPWAEDRFGAAVTDNVRHWLDRPLTWLVLAVSAAFIVVGVRRISRRTAATELTTAGIAAAPALLPFIWYEIASNHSQTHFWFTYRSLPIALGVVLLAVLSSTHSPEFERADVGVPVA